MSRTDRRRGKSASSAEPARLTAKAIGASERRLLAAVARGEWISVEQLPTADPATPVSQRQRVAFEIRNNSGFWSRALVTAPSRR